MDCMSSTAIGSTPAKGSSKRMNFGLTAKARAISVLLRSPPDSKSPLVVRMCCNPNSFNKSSNFSACCSLVILVISKTALMFSSTESFRKTEAS